MSQTVVVVEDEADIRELVVYNLLKEGFRAVGIGTGEEALRLIGSATPDLVVLDLMLPGIDGLSVCEKLKSQPQTQAIPVIMLTAKGEESDIVRGLNMGADDYIPKPFSPRVLIARVQAVLRRSSKAEIADATKAEQPICIHEIVIHLGRHEVLVDGEPVELTSTEFRVLNFLARRPGWVFTREQILDAVHGDNYAITDRAVDVQVVGLRRKLGKAGKYIETVRGVGYRFKE